MDSGENQKVKRQNTCYKHNSLVDFSFMEEKQSANALTLSKLNSLFGKVADRNEMGIRADKLFQLIQKSDANKTKLEWYRHKLGIGLNDDGTMKSCSGSRMISRGPFIAIFKHESITFVNVLENIARPLINRRRKRKNKGTSVKSGNQTVRCTVKSAPVKSSTSNSKIRCDMNSDDDSAMSNKSPPKRPKVEDKTGMIIITKFEDDVLSTVSESPTSDGSIAASPSPSTCAQMSKPFALGDSNSTPSVRKKGSHRSRSSRKNSSRKGKKDKRRESLRPIKSIGDHSREKAEESEDFGVRSLFSDKTSLTQAETKCTTDESSKGHDRSPSNTDTVDIREVLYEYAFQGNGYNFNYFMPPHFYHPTANKNVPSHTIHSSLHHGQTISTTHSNIPTNDDSFNVYHNCYMAHSYHPNAFPNVCWRGGTNMLYCTQDPRTTEFQTAEDTECFIMKGITAFFKRLFGLDKRREVFVCHSARNQLVSQRTPDEWDQLHEQGIFQAPNRPRTRSRVFSESSIESHESGKLDDLLSVKGDFSIHQPEMPTIPTNDEKHIQSNICQTNSEQSGKVLPGYDREHPKVFKVDGFKDEKALAEWKAAGPKVNPSQYSIVDDFNLDRPYTYGNDKEVKCDPTRLEHQEINPLHETSKRIPYAQRQKVLRERNSKDDHRARPNSLMVSSRSKTEGTIGTRYSSTNTGLVCDNSSIHSTSFAIESRSGYFHYR